jgi:hypothetical protein
MAKFSRDRSEPYTLMKSVRLTDRQAKLLAEISDRLGIVEAEVIRRAFDYWIRHAPEAKAKGDRP